LVVSTGFSRRATTPNVSALVHLVSNRCFLVWHTDF
jgi:hypothetical protein